MSKQAIRVRLCENCYFGRAGTVVIVPIEYAEALVMDKKATPLAGKTPKQPAKGGLDGR